MKLFLQVLRLGITLLVVLGAGILSLKAGTPPDRAFNPGNSANPYGLPDLDSYLSSVPYTYCAWGVLMDESVLPGTPETLYFTHLTSGSYGSSNQELFISRSRNQLDTIPLPASFWHAPINQQAGYITFAANPLHSYYLIRKYHYPSSLKNQMTSGPIGNSTKKAIILIHGWNPSSDNDAYDNGEFLALKLNVQSALNSAGASDWALVTYNWEKDADAGPKSVASGINGSEAAEAGNRHGLHLGQLIDELTDHGIEKIHYIAHSAGTWVARSATRYLLKSRADNSGHAPIKIQVTLLDPFVPGDLGVLDGRGASDLVRSEVSAINEFYGANTERLFRIENYYSDDEAAGTNGVFDWRGTDIDEPNRLVGRRLDVLSYYGHHSGPVLYYSDTVSTSGGSASGANAWTRLAIADLESQNALKTWGWQRSMFYNEPVISLQPQGPTQTMAVGSTWSTSIGATIRGGGQPLSTNRIQYLWQTKMPNGAWTPTPSGSLSYKDSFNYTSPALTSAHNGMKVRCLLYNRAGENTSEEFSINVIISGGTTSPVVTTAPAVPTNFKATAISSSSISLAWDPNANASGFRIERKTGAGGSWSVIVANKPVNSTTHTDSGRSVGTTYFYRLAAFNSAGTSAFSNEASATTSQGPSQVRDLVVTFENGGTTSNYSYSPNPVSTVTNHVLRYTDGTIATLTAPGTGTNGNLFSHWFREGYVPTTTQAISLTVSQSETLKAVYVPPPVVDSRSLNLSVSPSLAGTATGNGNFGQGAWVTIKATSNSGYNFWNWTTSGGQLFSASAELSFQLTTNLNLVANFVPTGGAYSVIATANPSAGGTISGAGNYSTGQTATLVATPADGWTFGTWSENGAILSFNSTVSFPVNQSREIVATFNPDFSKNYTLSITAINGTAIRSPNQTAYTPGSTVNVTATPHPGYYFTGWSQDLSGTANPLPVLMTANKKITANFSPVPASTYTLTTVSSTFAGTSATISKTPNQAFYPAGSSVQLHAVPSPGAIFVGWRGDGHGTANPWDVTMDSNKTIVAQCVPPSSNSAILALTSPLFTFNIPGTASSGVGTLVNVGPHSATMYYAAISKVPWIRLTCTAGTTPGGSEGNVCFQAEENPSNSPRTGEIWIYAPGAINSPQIFTVNQAAAVPHFTLETSAENGTISRSPDQTRYPTGGGVTLTAVPTEGYAFSSWSGDGSGSQNPLSITINSNKVITAEFVRLPKPDVVAQLSPSLSIGPAGSKLVFNGAVKNLGVDPAAAGKVYLRISESSTTPPAVTFGQPPFVDFSALNPNGSENMSLEFVIPQDLAIGGYHLWVLADPENACGEQSGYRANNQTAYAFQVLPDTIAPSIQVSVPSGAFSKTMSPTLNLAGNASDNVAVTQISWENDRGGSGAAVGLNEWAVNEVPLQIGINVITITAFDGEGNRARSMRTVTHYPPEDVPPTIAVTFPTTESTFNVIEDRMSLGGVASDNFAVAQVVWTNDRGGSGTATGLEAWVVDAVSLKPGWNKITITSTDHAGNVAEATLSVTHTPKSIPHQPVTVIRKPASGARIEGNGTIVEGTASARDGIGAVYYQVNDGPWLKASGSAQWSFTTDLAASLNAVRVKTVDTFGVESLVVSRLLTRVLRSGLGLDVIGEGTVTYGGFKSPVGLEIGKNYKLTAKPKKGWVFEGWSGGLVSSLPAITFTMQDSLEVTATFVENPFPMVSGSYLGLAGGEPESHETNGLLQATVTTAGGFSGKLLLGGRSHVVKGGFDSNGQWAGEIKRGKEPPLSALLMLDVQSGSDTINGLVSDGTFTVAINTDRATFNAKTSIAPTAGRYTFAIEPEENAASAPVGFGAGTLVVDSTGKATVKGTLADATTITFTSQVSKHGTWPLHVPLYKSSGSITGEMLFADLTDSDSSGGLHWFKPEQPKDTRFKAGFETRPAFYAQAYAAPARNERILVGWNSTEGVGTLSVFGPDWVDELLQPLIWGTDNKLSADSSGVEGLKWVPAANTGLFKGSFLDPMTRKPLPMNGALLQKTSEGLGWFQTPTGTGSVLIEKDTE